MVIDLRRLRKQTSKVLRPSEHLLAETAKPLENLLRKKWLRPSAISAGSMVVLVLLYLLVWPSIHGPVLGAKRIPIAVIPFENQTGDPQFDYLRSAIPSLLITSLEQSTSLRVTTRERMRDLLKQMGKADTQAINTDLGFEVCRRDSVKALVTGSFVKMGDMFATAVQVVDVETKQLLKSAGSKGKGVRSILEVQIDELGKQIATGIGLPESKVAVEQKAITAGTTSSLDAYNFYLRGVQEHEKMDFIEARRYLEKATSLDSTFAMAQLYLPRNYNFLGDEQSARAAYERAFKFSDKVPRKEKLYIDAAYADAIESDREKQYQILKQLESEFPREKEVHYRLYTLGGEEAIPQLQQAIDLDPTWGLAVNQLAYEYFFKGDYENALRLLKQYASMSPGDANPYDSMGEMYFLMGRLDESIANYKQALEINPRFSYFQIAYIYALTENYADAVKWIEKRPEENTARFLQCFFAWWLGRNSEASTRIAAASELFKKSGNQWYEGGLEGLRAVILADRGQFDRARNAFAEAARLTRARASEQSGVFDLLARLLELQRAKLFLREGQTQPVEKMLAELPPTPQKIMEVAKSSLPFEVHQVQGELFLVQGNVDRAINHLKNPPALPPPLMSFPTLMVSYNLTFARDGLARAYVQKGDIDLAIAEYERITHFDPSSKDRRLIHPLHRYELAKLYEKKGMKEKAVAQYEKFLSIWKNADADRLEPKNPRARLAKIKAR